MSAALRTGKGGSRCKERIPRFKIFYAKCECVAGPGQGEELKKRLETEEIQEKGEYLRVWRERKF